jgi:hypothetical protein
MERSLPGLIDKLDHFFQDAHLEPGTYTFANQYYPFIKSGELKGFSSLRKTVAKVNESDGA